MKFKAILLVLGCGQREGIDYNKKLMSLETDAPASTEWKFYDKEISNLREQVSSLYRQQVSSLRQQAVVLSLQKFEVIKRKDLPTGMIM
jgi:hypothetical protein